MSSMLDEDQDDMVTGRIGWRLGPCVTIAFSRVALPDALRAKTTLPSGRSCQKRWVVALCGSAVPQALGARVELRVSRTSPSSDGAAPGSQDVRLRSGREPER